MSNPLRLARPTFLKDKQDIKAMDNYIKNKCKGGTGFTLFDSVGKDIKNRFNDLYKPVVESNSTLYGDTELIFSRDRFFIIIC